MLSEVNFADAEQGESISDNLGDAYILLFYWLDLYDEVENKEVVFKKLYNE